MFQVEGNSSTIAEKQAALKFSNSECFSFAGGPHTSAEVEAKGSGKISQKRTKDKLELGNWALPVGNGEPAKNF